MIYLANALFNSKLALEIHEGLLERSITSYLPDINIEYEGRKININAFEQLRKRNPNNVYLVELKKQINGLLINKVVESTFIIICNSQNDNNSLPNQTMFEIAIGWYTNKIIYSYNAIVSSDRELLNAIGVISLDGDINKFKIEKEETKNTFNPFTEMSKEKTKSKRHTLTIGED